MVGSRILQQQPEEFHNALRFVVVTSLERGVLKSAWLTSTSSRATGESGKDVCHHQ